MAYTENEIYYPYDYDASADVPEDMKTMAESIDEVVGEIKGTQTSQGTRITNLETDNTTNKANILTNATNITNLQSENTRLKKNQIYGTATGTEVEITDSAEMGASIGVSGESEQDEEPSPSNPSEIKNLTGNTVCKVCNKNLSPALVKGYIDINTGILNTSYNSYKSTEDFAKLEVGKQLKAIRYDGKKGIRIYYYELDETFIKSEANSSAEEWTTEIYDRDVLIKYMLMNTEANVEVKTMLCDVNADTTYVAPEEKTITFPLGAQKLAKGDYLASDGIHNVRVQKVFDGSSNENWTLSATLTTVTRFLINCINAPVTLIEQLCSHFKYLYKYSDDTEHFYINPSNGSLFIFINTSTAGTVEELKAWLSNEPITIECEPESGVTVTPYTQAQQTAYNNLQNLILFEGYNHIEMISPNGVKANLTVNYTKNTGIVIQNLDERIQALENAILEV